MAETNDEKIKLCPRHDEYEVPLIFTFAFPRNEYWCPHCGYLQGIFGSADTVDSTPELLERLRLFRKFSDEYLHAEAVTYCSSTLWEGSRIDPDDLPDEEKERLAKIRSEWKYDIKIEDQEVAACRT